MKVKNLLKAIVSIILLIILLYRVGFEEILNTLNKFNIWFVPILIALSVVNIVLGAANIYVLFRGLKHKISFRSVLIYFGQSWSISFVLPGRIGNLPLVYIMRKKVAMGVTSAVAMMDNLLKYSIVLFIFIFSWLEFFNLESGIQIFGVILIVSLFSLLAFSKKGRQFIRSYILRSHAKKFSGFAKNLTHLAFKRPYSLLLLNFFIAILKVGVNALLPFLGFMALGVNVPFIDVLMIYSIALMASGLPISISGIGVKETVGVYLYSLIGISAEISAAMYLIVLVFNYSMAFIVYWVSDTFSEN